MADNVGIKGGTDALIATDEVTIGGTAVQVQRVKIGYGADGAYAEVSDLGGLPVRGEVSIDAPTVAALLASRPVTGPLTDAQLRAAAVDVAVVSGGGSGATSTHRLIATASTNATSVKASAGAVHKIVLQNISPTTLYLKIYNKASAPTVGTDTPTNTYAAYPAQTLDLSFQGGKPFAAGIAYALTALAADNNAAAVGAGSLVNIEYA